MTEIKMFETQFKSVFKYQIFKSAFLFRKFDYGVIRNCFGFRYSYFGFN